MKADKARKAILIGLSCLLAAVTLSSCAGDASKQDEAQADVQKAAVYHKLSAADAKAVIDTEENVLILDVREQYEYDAGHIPDAVLLPSGSITARAAEVLPDKDQKILVYCRSGNRSATAARALVSLGYTQVYDFGGIIDWPYDVVK